MILSVGSERRYRHSSVGQKMYQHAAKKNVRKNRNPMIISRQSDQRPKTKRARHIPVAHGRAIRSAKSARPRTRNCSHLACCFAVIGFMRLGSHSSGSRSSPGGGLTPKYNSNNSSREGSCKGPEQRGQLTVPGGAHRSQTSAGQTEQNRHDCAHRSGSPFATGFPPGIRESEIALEQLLHA